MQVKKKTIERARIHFWTIMNRYKNMYIINIPPYQLIKLYTLLIEVEN